ncbi:Na(+)-translocating NADH-quinone reductase subunit C [Planctomycetes bacterium Pla163]|uniref:Na(+)-translocating NADH-quinone reductase subunit C n=1 Tax=Rohdeia mirabilis TaxID=2528008 RepID=A0A518D0J2_9BACT|nr:Na(+)-translocating NADH-quinone reductase subunit C [Planctomycetes bacterium Pla163]
MDFSNKYVVGFAVVLCLVCAAAVSVLAVELKPQQEANMLLDRRTNVLRVAGVLETGETRTAEEINAFFEDGRIEYLVVERASGKVVDDPSTIEGIDSAESFDATKWAKDNAKNDQLTSPIDPAYKETQMRVVPAYLQVIKVTTDEVDCLVLPIQGYGLWSTLRGYLAVSRDLSHVIGITYYEHGETPGLGGEVDNPSWKAQFPGKEIYGDQGEPILEVKKSGMVTEPSHQVDGMAGATITTDGVDLMLEFWLGDGGYGPYLKAQRGDA